MPQEEDARFLTCQIVKFCHELDVRYKDLLSFYTSTIIWWPHKNILSIPIKYPLSKKKTTFFLQWNSPCMQIYHICKHVNSRRFFIPSLLAPPLPTTRAIYEKQQQIQEAESEGVYVLDELRVRGRLALPYSCMITWLNMHRRNSQGIIIAILSTGWKVIARFNIPSCIDRIWWPHTMQLNIYHAARHLSILLCALEGPCLFVYADTLLSYRTPKLSDSLYYDCLLYTSDAADE